MLSQVLQRRLTAAGAAPFYTHYEAETRIELSGVTFANWVDKTANFLDTLDVEPGDLVSLELAHTHPGHWVTAVWLMACWQRGAQVSPERDPGAALLVGGPDVVASGQTVACSLHPLGLAFPSPPPGCIDYAEVFSEPDLHFSIEPSPGDQAWPGVTFEELLRTEPRSGVSMSVDPVPGFATVAELLVAPILGGGATVVATGCDDERIAVIRRQEKLPGLGAGSGG